MTKITGNRRKILELLNSHGELSGGHMRELDKSLPFKNIHTILERMEHKKWLSSRIKKIPGERNRPRRFYKLTDLGVAALEFSYKHDADFQSKKDDHIDEERETGLLKRLISEIDLNPNVDPPILQTLSPDKANRLWAKYQKYLEDTEQGVIKSPSKLEPGEEKLLAQLNAEISANPDRFPKVLLQPMSDETRDHLYAVALRTTKDDKTFEKVIIEREGRPPIIAWRSQEGKAHSMEIDRQYRQLLNLINDRHPTTEHVPPKDLNTRVDLLRQELENKDHTGPYAAFNDLSQKQGNTVLVEYIRESWPRAIELIPDVDEASSKTIQARFSWC